MSMDIYSEPGTKIVFLDRNGTEYDRADAEKVLEVGQVYTLIGIEISSWISHITLEEIPGIFNSVMFDNLTLA